MLEEEYKVFVRELDRENKEYKEQMKKLSADDLYESYYQIHAHEEFYNFLINYGKNYMRKDFAKTDIVEDLYYRFMKTEYDLTQDDLREFIYYDIQDRYKKETSEEM